MTLVADGSRVCDWQRVSLGAIDESVTLTDRFRSFIFCGGVYVDGVSDRWDTAQSGTQEWYWRVVGGSWAPVAAQGEVKFGDYGTVLTGLGVINGDKRTNETPTSVSDVLWQWVVPETTEIKSYLVYQESAEGQIALNIADAPLGAVYEMMSRCVYNNGVDSVDIVYPARFTVPMPPMRESVIPAPPEQDMKS